MARRLDQGELGAPPYDASTGKPRVVLVNALHPGGVRTGQPPQLGKAYGWPGKIVAWAVSRMLADPVTMGCRSGVFAVTGKDLYEGSGIHGQYVVPDKKIGVPNSKGQEQEMGKRLWRMCLEILRDRLGEWDYGFDTLP
jgi:hypothetical protein